MKYKKLQFIFQKKVESKIYDNGDIKILITHKCPESSFMF